MIITVKDIPITGKTYTGQIREKDLDMDLKFLKPVLFDGTAYKSAEDIRLCGHIATCIEANCHLCLEAFPFELDANFEVYYRPLPTHAQLSDNAELTIGELGVMHYDENSIDLSIVARDTIIVEMPMRLICKQDCLGLCPHCGENRNKTECQCHEKNNASNPFKSFFQNH
ncbi:MAG: DUF177 domain-containing protein [Candidatus Brocadiae bacterium]|nr:DUF177 domain-containing protein [Candidatus Brocadiia bacterium]